MNNQRNNPETKTSTIVGQTKQQKKINQISPGHIDPKNKMKKFKTKKSILKKDSRVYCSKKEKKIGIKWDEKAIDELNDYRKKHRLTNVQRNKIKSLSNTKYNSEIKGVEDDQYLKHLIKVNETTINDELIKNIIKMLKEPKEKIVRNYSTQLKAPNMLDLQENSNSPDLENKDVFDDVLDDEVKLTLQNTIINKFQKEVLKEIMI